MIFKSIYGLVQIKTILNLEDLGEIMSKKILSNLKLGGLEFGIGDGSSTLFLDFLGFRFFLSQEVIEDDFKTYYFREELRFYPKINSWPPNFETERVDLNNYLFQYLSFALQEFKDIEIVEFKIS